MGEDQLYTLDVSSVDKTVCEIPLSDLLESFEIVKLENRPEAFSKMWKGFIDEDFIGLFAHPDPLKLFTREGKFICNIGGVGEGPGEYFSVIHASFDKNNNRAYLSDFRGNQIKVYELSSGTFLPEETILLPEQCHFPKFYIDSKEKELTVFHIPFQASKTDTRYKERNVNFGWVQDFKGNILQSVSAEEYAIPANFSSSLHLDVFQGDPPVLTVRLADINATRNDTLYYYDKARNELIPRFTTNLPSDPLYLIRVVESTLYYYAYGQKYTVEANPEYLEKLWTIQVNKSTKEARYIEVVNDYLGGIEFEFSFFLNYINREYFFKSYEPLELKDLLEGVLQNNTSLSDKKRRELTKLKDSLHENDNNVLLIGKLKTK
ncbi:6-bladed beta-propeller [Bacteroides fragilis]|uniref:6-bladed beta-propeller n=1 Tax=Bacteroides fragilis TaxID=817 RepID=UPI002810B601|nr:6-bladed beta-propeller [Bacteroides fragilis]WMI93114.1 6-bladed beta-propeller [Bacteroides fragilis]